VNLRGVTQHKHFKPFIGAVVVSLLGVTLGQTHLGDPWTNASYDYLFCFGARPITNKVALILLDNAAYKEHRQMRGQPWDRVLHAQLLEKLAKDGCPLVVLDLFFRSPGKTEVDETLAAAMRKNGRVVLVADAVIPEHQVAGPLQLGMEGAQVDLPHKQFLEAATNWGVGKAAANWGGTPRQHWPFPAPASFESLPWAAARLAGASLPEEPVRQWLRYYGEEGPWSILSYHLALAKTNGYFHDSIVFVGSDPEQEDPGLSERDKFSTPYTRWNDKAVGGVKILATTFLNLMNHDWLRRPAPWIEVLLLLITGATLGALPFLARPLAAGGITLSVAAAAMFGTVLLSYFGDFWFPWLLVAGAQAPCGLALVLAGAWGRRETISTSTPTGTVVVPAGAVLQRRSGVLPDAPDYQFCAPAFGEGAFGKVWLVRNAIGQWQALKAVYQAKFGDNTRPYDMEFSGIRAYKPTSEEHLGLLRVDFVSQKKPQGYFYYVMELGDARASGWEENPETYRSRDLAWVRDQAEKKRIPVAECVSIGLALTDALEFLHAKGLTHRDIKPSNIIFVNGRPKLADVGLVTRARTAQDVTSYAGTPDYMPPHPEPPGTKQADIYALGMVLFVISTGREPAFFPDLKTTLVMNERHAEFILLNPIILKACEADITKRYSSAAEMRAALQAVQKLLEQSQRTNLT